MKVQTPGLAGQKGSRRQILLELKKDQPLRASDLADRLAVSRTATRRHMKELEAEGLIDYGREQRGYGAPTFAYRLTDAGEALFPNRYEETTTKLIEYLVKTEGRSVAAEVVGGQCEEMMGKIEGELDGLSPFERLEKVAQVFEEAGFMAEVIRTEESTQLLLRNCAVHAVAMCLPEICETEENLIKKLLGVDVHRTTHIVEGCNACEYVVSIAADQQTENLI